MNRTFITQTSGEHVHALDMVSGERYSLVLDYEPMGDTPADIETIHSSHVEAFNGLCQMLKIPSETLMYSRTKMWDGFMVWTVEYR